MSMHSSKSSRKRSALSFDRRDLKNKFENKKIQYFMNIKKIVSIVLLLLALSMALASCNFSDIEPTPPVSGGESGGEQPETPNTPEDGGETPEVQKVPTYEEYLAMTADEQEAFCDSFASPSEFILWHKEAKAKYDEEHKTPEIGGDVDLEDLLNPQD